MAEACVLATNCSNITFTAMKRDRLKISGRFWHIPRPKPIYWRYMAAVRIPPALILREADL